ncbi:hypothetical protein HDV05_002580, partial [Chytridiales sp. JEL 0842]
MVVASRKKIKLDIDCHGGALESYIKDVISDGNFDVGQAATRLLEDQITRVSHLIKHSDKVYLVTGAGISVSLGIGTFRGGSQMTSTVGKKKRKVSAAELFHTTHLRQDAEPDYRAALCNMLRDIYKAGSKATTPTRFHTFATDLLLSKKLETWFTQNIDFIESLAVKNCPQSIRDRVVQIHGDVSIKYCTKCGQRNKLNPDGTDTYYEHLKLGPVFCPSCEKLHRHRRSVQRGEMLPYVYLYGNDLNWRDGEKNMAFLDNAVRQSTTSTVWLVVGTTLSIDALAQIVKQASKVAKVILVEPNPKHFRNISFDMTLTTTADDFAEK